MQIQQKSKASSSSSFGKQLQKIMSRIPEDKLYQMRVHSRPSSKSDLFEKLARSYDSRYSDKVSDQKNSFEEEKEPPRPEPENVHNCVCQVFGDCLGVNCNCFLSTLPCSPLCCSTCTTLKNTQSLQKHNPCACKRTKCLMLYCECLANNKYCTAMCHCYSCQNHESSHDRKKAIQEIIEREPERFSHVPQSRIRSCKCRKTRCDKKYCNCFNSGVSCSVQCKCVSCKNNKPERTRKMVVEMEEEKEEKISEPIIKGSEMQFEFALHKF